MGARAPIEAQAHALHATAEDLARALRHRTEGRSWWICVLRETAVRLENPGDRRRRGPDRDHKPEEYVNAETERARKARYRVEGP